MKFFKMFARIIEFIDYGERYHLLKQHGLVP